MIFLLLLIPALFIGSGQVGLLSGKRPSDLGIIEGRLKPPPSSPNCVSSQAKLYPGHEKAFIEPLIIRDQNREATFEKLKKLLDQKPEAKLVTSTSNYLYYEFQSSLMKYIDDVEFYLPENKEVMQIEMRSASRIGYGDLGKNRNRLEAIRAQL